MMEPTSIARPYAQAVFATAKANDAFDAWSTTLAMLDLATAAPKVANVLDDPEVSLEAKDALLEAVCGHELSDQGRRFVDLLVHSGRIALLPYIRELFEEMKDTEQGIERATIASAFPVSETELAAVKEGLQRRFGKRVEATVVVDPELLGGARITVGDTVIDASLRHRLQAMEESLRAA